MKQTITLVYEWAEGSDPASAGKEQRVSSPPASLGGAKKCAAHPRSFPDACHFIWGENTLAKFGPTSKTGLQAYHWFYAIEAPRPGQQRYLYRAL